MDIKSQVKMYILSGTETYIFTDENNYDSEILSPGVINSYVAAYLEALEAENNIKFKQKKYELDLVYQDLLEQERLWNAQVNYIIDIGNKEWKKAAERIYNDHNTWKANFDEAYEKASAEWNKNYKEFQESKQQWTMVQYMNASQGKWEEAAAVNGSDLEKTINDALQKSGLIGKINDSLEGMASDVESYIDSITNTALLNSIMDSASNLSTRAGIGTKIAKVGNEISRDAEKWLDEAQAKSVALQKEYDKVAAKLSEQQMRAQLEATIDGYMARIDSQNESMREWEEKLVLADGYISKREGF